MKHQSFAVKGTLCWCDEQRRLTVQQGYAVCENGVSAGVFAELPERWKQLPVLDWGDSLVLPGMVDLHVHAPQYPNLGLGMDKELIDWLNERTFPEERKYKDLAYAERSYRLFAEDLVHSATTRACIFATIHTPATLLLMELLEESGLCAFVGKVNMDRNAPDYLLEGSVKQAIRETRRWMEESRRFHRVRPILTPRFVPSVTDGLMKALGELRWEYDLPVQSHLSENLGEIQWVKELCPDSRFYGDAYDRFGMFGGDSPTIMAHCIHSDEEELALIQERGVTIAHCPSSNTNLASGIAPVRRYLDRGMSIGLGTDVSGGSSLSLLRAITDAIQCSKLRWRLVDQSLAPLSVEEAFYLATRGGGAFFGKVGSFEPGFAFDAVVLNDKPERCVLPLTGRERLERALYRDCPVQAKIVDGRRIF